MTCGPAPGPVTRPRPRRSPALKLPVPRCEAKPGRPGNCLHATLVAASCRASVRNPCPLPVRQSARSQRRGLGRGPGRAPSGQVVLAGPPGQQRDPAASHADGPARASTPLIDRFLPAMTSQWCTPANSGLLAERGREPVDEPVVGPAVVDGQGTIGPGPPRVSKVSTPWAGFRPGRSPNRPGARRCGRTRRGAVALAADFHGPAALVDALNASVRPGR